MSTKETKLRVGADVKGLQRGLKRGEKHVRSFGKRVSKTLGSRKLGGLGKGMLGFGALGAGASMLAGVNNFMNYEDRLVRLGIQADISKERLLELKKQIHDVSTETGQKDIDLLSGIEQIVEKTGNFDFAVASLRDMALSATATGSAMADIGATAANLSDKSGLAAGEVKAMFDVLASQGKGGAFTLQNMAAQMERLTASAGRFGIKGVGGMRTFGAWLQLARKSTGSPEQATTAIERAIAGILGKRKQIKRATGFEVLDLEKSREAGVEVYKPLEKILKGVIGGARGSESKLLKIFGDEGIRAISYMAQQYREGKGFAEYDKFTAAGGSGETIDKDFRRYMDEATKAQANTLAAEASELIDKGMTPAVGWLGGILKDLNYIIDDLKRHGINNNIDMSINMNDGKVITNTDSLNTKINLNRGNHVALPFPGH